MQRVSSDSSNYISYINDKLNLILNTVFYTFFSLNVIIELNFKVCLILSAIILIVVLMSVWYCINTKTIVNKKVTLSEGLIKKTMNSIYNPKMIKITNNQNNEVEYIHRIVINKNLLTSKQLEILRETKISLKKWDIKF